MQTTKTITKRIWGVLLALCMLLSLTPMAAFAAEDPGAVYDYRFVTEDTIEIMGYRGTETDLVIPSEINGYTVVGIKELDLPTDGTNTVETIVVPDTVKYLNGINLNNGYYWVENLKKITLPEGLEIIGDWAFAATPGVEEVNLPSTLKHIGESAFDGCRELRNFTIPAGVEHIGINAFRDTGMAFDLTKAAENSGNPFVVIGDELIAYASYDPVVTVPDGIKGIGGSAFSGYITSVTLPDSVEYIADYAFEMERDLTTVQFGSGLKEIGFGAFDGCTSLNNVVLPEGLKKIEYAAFADCTSLSSITFPGTLETLYPESLRDTPYFENLPNGENYLGSMFFYKYIAAEGEEYHAPAVHINVRPGTLGLMTPVIEGKAFDMMTYTLPDGLRYIGPNALSRVTGDITLPESVAYIDDISQGSGGLPLSILRNLPDALTYIGDYAFETDDQIDISYLEIPNGVKHIGQRAFYAINQGTKMDVRLPDSLEHMGWRAFAANNIGQVTNWPAAITTWDDFLAHCQMDALTLPDTILNVISLETDNGMPVNMNRAKQVGSDNTSLGEITCNDHNNEREGGTLLLMPNVEKFTETVIQGFDLHEIALSDKVTKLPDCVEVYGDIRIVPFDESMLEGLPDAPSSATPPAPMVGSFTDVRTNDWFAGAVEYVVNNGLFSGVSETSFAPNDAVTRGMLVTVLWRAAGEPSASASAFADVPADAWYAKAVAWANVNGIVQGYDASTFAPDDRITREQLAAIFQRYAGFKGMETSGRGDLSQFGDTGALSNWAQEGVSWAVGAGLISGKGDGVLDPQGATTRAEAAVILQRFLEK